MDISHKVKKKSVFIHKACLGIELCHLVSLMELAIRIARQYKVTKDCLVASVIPKSLGPVLPRKSIPSLTGVRLT